MHLQGGAIVSLEIKSAILTLVRLLLETHICVEVDRALDLVRAGAPRKVLIPLDFVILRSFCHLRKVMQIVLGVLVLVIKILVGIYDREEVLLKRYMCAF